MLQFLKSGFSWSALCVALVSGLRADAPDSLGDALFWETSGNTTRYDEIRSVRLYPNGTYKENWEIIGNYINESNYGVPGEFALPQKGTYTYSKISATVATISLTPDDDSGLMDYVLTYKGANSGNVDVVQRRTRGLFTLQANLATSIPLLNISTRVKVRNGESCFVGFVVGREGDFLVRTVGASLSQFDVKSTWAKPNFIIRDEKGTVYHPWGPTVGSPPPYYENYPPKWDRNEIYKTMHNAAFQATGEFALLPGTSDVAAIVHLLPGPYTVQCQAYGSDPGGEAVIEVNQMP